MPKEYEISLEIEGKFANFSRPDCGVTSISYPAPTQSAAKGIIEAIFFCPLTRIVPTRVEVMKPIKKRVNFSTNYGGPDRKTALHKKDCNQQVSNQLLADVCYRIYAKIENLKLNGNEPWLSENAKKHLKNNNAHFHKVEFEKRVIHNRRGCFRNVPFLGTKECTPSYVGPIRNKDLKPCEDVNVEIQSMLLKVFREQYGKPNPVFSEKPVKIIKGVLDYPAERP